MAPKAGGRPRIRSRVSSIRSPGLEQAPNAEQRRQAYLVSARSSDLRVRSSIPNGYSPLSPRAILEGLVGASFGWEPLILRLNIPIY
jgi:transposase